MSKRSPCEGCDGSGVRDFAVPSCPIDKIPGGWRVIERCDTCDKFPDDLEAAKAVALKVQWVKCRGGGDHAIGTGMRCRRKR